MIASAILLQGGDVNAASTGVNTAVKVALITGAVTAAGWFVTAIVTSVTSVRSKRLEIRQQYLQKQIEEFYGPLFSLVWQIFNSYDLKHRIVSGKQFDKDQRDKIEKYFESMHFKPLHEEIRSILKSKLYLVDGAEMPQSFYDYLQHSTQELIQQELWSSAEVDTSFLPKQHFPPQFYDDIGETLKQLMSEYQSRVDAYTGRITSDKPDKT